eukprot:TRINITY_DN7635_c0_g1_i11.p1 TRINITY_DN7635_c0_g1~~TRINITY_DN7635_c0_g1_i11.p1  ORF type:complete len:826 (-),score=156.05 TRINITY_DN7635_c0_g1_i11:232-2709(-)
MSTAALKGTKKQKGRFMWRQKMTTDESSFNHNKDEHRKSKDQSKSKKVVEQTEEESFRLHSTDRAERKKSDNDAMGERKKNFVDDQSIFLDKANGKIHENDKKGKKETQETKEKKKIFKKFKHFTENINPRARSPNQIWKQIKRTTRGEPNRGDISDIRNPENWESLKGKENSEKTITYFRRPRNTAPGQQGHYGQLRKLRHRNTDTGHGHRYKWIEKKEPTNLIAPYSDDSSKKRKRQDDLYPENLDLEEFEQDQYLSTSQRESKDGDLEDENAEPDTPTDLAKDDEQTRKWYSKLDTINQSQIDSPNRGSGKRISLSHRKRSGRQQDREDDIFEREEQLDTLLYEDEDLEIVKEMTWTIVIIVYKPATTRTVEDMIAKIDGVDQDAIHTIEPKFKQDVVILQSNSWMDIRKVATSLNTILGNKVEIILSLEKDIASEPYRTMVGFLQTQRKVVYQNMKEDDLKKVLEDKLKGLGVKDIAIIPSSNLVIINFNNPRERAKAAEDKRLMNEGTKAGRYKVLIEGKLEELRINWKAGPTPEGTHPFQLTFGHGKEMGTKVRNHNIEKTFQEIRKDKSPILPIRVFQDQIEGNNITVVEFANILDMARYIRKGIKIGEQPYELIQLGMLAQRIKELRTQDDNKNKQIMLRRPMPDKNTDGTMASTNLNNEIISIVKENTKEIGDLWTAVAAMNQAQSEHWQYSKMQTEVNTLIQLRAQLENNITEAKTKMRFLEYEKKMAKMEGRDSQQEIKEKYTKQSEKWKSLVMELNVVEEKIKDNRNQMEQIHQISMEKIMDWGRNSSARMERIQRIENKTQTINGCSGPTGK